MRRHSNERHISFIKRVLGLFLWKFHRSIFPRVNRPGDWINFDAADHVHVEFREDVVSAGTSIQRRLQGRGVNSVLGGFKECSSGNHAVIFVAPVAFTLPKEPYFVYQLEPMGSSSHYNRGHLQKLDRASGIFDYSACNIEFMARAGFDNTKMKLENICPTWSISPEKFPSYEDRDIDVLFYGWMRSKRRREAIEFLRQRLDVNVVESVFGEDMDRIIARAKVVINVHFDPNSPLEQVRLAQVFAQGTPVVSEWAPDLGDWTHSGSLQTVPVGDWFEMAERSLDLLDDPERWRSVAEEVQTTCHICVSSA